MLESKVCNTMPDLIENFYFLRFILFMSMCLPVCIYMCVSYVFLVRRGQKKALEPMDLTIEACLAIECCISLSSFALLHTLRLDMFSMSEFPDSSEHFFCVLKAA